MDPKKSGQTSLKSGQTPENPLDDHNSLVARISVSRFFGRGPSPCLGKQRKEHDSSRTTERPEEDITREGQQQDNCKHQGQEDKTRTQRLGARPATVASSFFPKREPGLGKYPRSCSKSASGERCKRLPAMPKRSVHVRQNT